MERLMLLNVLKDVGTKPCNDSYQNVTNAVSYSVKMLKKNQMFQLQRRESCARKGATSSLMGNLKRGHLNTEPAAWDQEPKLARAIVQFHLHGHIISWGWTRLRNLPRIPGLLSTSSGIQIQICVAAEPGMRDLVCPRCPSAEKVFLKCAYVSVLPRYEAQGAETRHNLLLPVISPLFRGAPRLSKYIQVSKEFTCQ